MFIVCVVIFFCFACSVATDEECQTRGKQGSCKNMKDCSYAQALLKDQQNPDICGFEGLDAIVCCLLDEKPSPLSIKLPLLSTPENEKPSPLTIKLPLLSRPENEKPSPLSMKLPSLSRPENEKPSPLSMKLPLLSRPENEKPSPLSMKQPLLSRPEKVQHKSLSEIKCEQFYPKPKFPVLVTGGVKSLAKEFPHMAIIGFGEDTDKQWQCGGSLVTKRFVLTAAHCLDSLELGPAKWIRLGDLDLATSNDEAEPQDFSVNRRIYHPNYNHPSRYDDIALLELDRPVSLTLFVSPACLHDKKELPDFQMTATGWGKKGFIDSYSSYLLKVDLNRVDIVDCREYFANISRRFLSRGILDDSQLCAGGVLGQDTCQGDSGGPLQVKNIRRTFVVKVHTLIGVTSFGKACGLSPSPGVYTRVSNYVSWIENVVWPNETWDNYEGQLL